MEYKVIPLDDLNAFARAGWRFVAVAQTQRKPSTTFVTAVLVGREAPCSAG